jgi:DNA-binding transcriptional regulator YiaG
MTPADLKEARHKLGLSAEGFARLVRVESGRTVRRWESGERDIPGPVLVILDLIEAIPAVRKKLAPQSTGDTAA